MKFVHLAERLTELVQNMSDLPDRVSAIESRLADPIVKMLEEQE